MNNFKPGAPLWFSSIATLLKENREKYANKEAVISVDPHSGKFDNINYRDFYQLIFQTVSLLISLDIKKGDNFAILMPNTAEVLLFELAGALIGATTIPLDIKRDTFSRKIFKIKETGAKALFIHLHEVDQAELRQIKEEFPKLNLKSWKDFTRFKKLLPKTLHDFPVNDSLDTPYVILYTSGTTSNPKGVPISIRACLLNAMGIATWQKMTDRDRFNVVLPLHHINSTIFCLSIILSGGTIILNKTYSASNFWQIVAKFHCTNTSIVPTILHDLLAKKDDFFAKKLDISFLKKICIGSAPVLPEQTLKFYQTFKIRVTQGYGQTETALRVSGVPVDLPEKTYIQMLKNNSIGTKLSNNLLAIMDPENNPKKEGEEGEICIFGPTLGEGYLNNPKATTEAFKNGWFHSGDLGYYKNMEIKLKNGKLKDKFYFIVGRTKEIIIKGGVNISPSAIEDALLKAYPEISQVCVVGYPDKRMGEEIAACIVIKKGSNKDALESGILHTPNGSISKYEVPKKVFFMEGLPKTSTGKIQRVEVKKWLSERLLATQNYLTRIIKPEETNVLRQALEINNQGFKDVPASLEKFRQRAKNGILIGVFDSENKLLGSLSCVQSEKSEIEKIKTWEEATANGTLKNNNPKGNTLVCVGISVQRKPQEKTPINHIPDEKLRKLAREKISEYLEKDLDHVINFHKKPKGGIEGAKVFKILEEGRKKDKESVGYNILMKYPTINQKTKITFDETSSPSIKLMEFAFILAKKKESKISLPSPALQDSGNIYCSALATGVWTRPIFCPNHKTIKSRL